MIILGATTSLFTSSLLLSLRFPQFWLCWVMLVGCDALVRIHFKATTNIPVTLYSPTHDTYPFTPLPCCHTLRLNACRSRLWLWPLHTPPAHSRSLLRSRPRHLAVHGRDGPNIVPRSRVPRCGLQRPVLSSSSTKIRHHLRKLVP